MVSDLENRRANAARGKSHQIGIPNHVADRFDLHRSLVLDALLRSAIFDE